MQVVTSGVLSGNKYKLVKASILKTMTNVVAYLWAKRDKLGFKRKYRYVTYPPGCYDFYVNVTIYSLAYRLMDFPWITEVLLWIDPSKL